MKERLRFVVAHESDLYSMMELCERFGISRKTGYKWLERFEAEGPGGLENRSRKPHRSPSRTAENIRSLLIEERLKHPKWGPEKLLDVVGRGHPEIELPARNTVADDIEKRRLGERAPPTSAPHTPRETRESVTATPNQLWTADFKGEFKTLDGVWCYPLTVADQFSRFILGIDGLLDTKGKRVRAVFERLFHESDRPASIRTDNGTPFVGTNRSMVCQC